MDDKYEYVSNLLKSLNQDSEKLKKQFIFNEFSETDWINFDEYCMKLKLLLIQSYENLCWIKRSAYEEKIKSWED